MRRYSKTEQYKSSEGNRYYTNPIYPDIPLSEDDTYVITTIGDRYDILAQQYYSDSTLWWVIASANNGTRDSLVPTLGAQLRIPTNIDDIIDAYYNLNAIR